MKPQPSILVVDDDQETRSLLQDFLHRHGLAVSVARDGEEMQAILRRSSFDLIILDVMLPGRNGLQLCQDIRARSRTPIIMLTAVTETTDRVVGLEMGADDYVAKPFDPRELLARIRAVLRRLEPDGSARPPARRQQAQLYRFAGWTLDVGRRRLSAPDGVRVELTTAEFNLLLTLIQSAQRVLSREQVIEMSGGDPARSFDRSVDILISRLRRKMEDNPRAPKLILTVRGGGYQFGPEITAE
ncbi:response regulator [Jiella sp. M17.18]|uniref:response regulator n=1 Tax=Jiella sp. M17.18 TaxID=3234247 RepID=UPI0034DECBD3